MTTVSRKRGGLKEEEGPLLLLFPRLVPFASLQEVGSLPSLSLWSWQVARTRGSPEIVSYGYGCEHARAYSPPSLPRPLPTDVYADEARRPTHLFTPFIGTFYRLARKPLTEALQSEENLVDAAYVAVAWISFLPFALTPFAAGRWASAGWAAGSGARASFARALGLPGDDGSEEEEGDSEDDEDSEEDDDYGLPMEGRGRRISSVVEVNRKRSSVAKSHWQQPQSQAQQPLYAEPLYPEVPPDAILTVEGAVGGEKRRRSRDGGVEGGSRRPSHSQPYAPPQVAQAVSARRASEAKGKRQQKQMHHHRPKLQQQHQQQLMLLPASEQHQMAESGKRRHSAYVVA